MCRNNIRERTNSGRRWNGNIGRENKRYWTLNRVKYTNFLGVNKGKRLITQE
jgi:hypothetical protein